MNKASQRKIIGIVAKIEKHKTAIAKHRDALRDVYDDLECVLESADRGVEGLESAIATLSEYV